MASRLARIANRAVTEDEKFLVSVARAAVAVRNAQKAFYRYKGADPAEKRSLLIDSKEKEKALDDLLATQVDDGGQQELPEVRNMKEPIGEKQ